MIGKKIASIRKQKGYSLSKLAAKTNVSKSYLSNIERNLNQNPSLLIIQKIAKVLDVNIETLLDTADEKISDSIIDKEWADFIAELKGLGIDKDQLIHYKTLIEFIKWKNQNSDLG